MYIFVCAYKTKVPQKKINRQKNIENKLTLKETSLKILLYSTSSN